MFTVRHYSKFHMPAYSYSLVFANKPKSAGKLFYIQQEIALRKK
jgi:hypothetical protein